MNDHLIQPFELRICLIFLFFHGGFEFELKSCHYWAQKRVISKKLKNISPQQILFREIAQSHPWDPLGPNFFFRFFIFFYKFLLKKL